MKTLSLAVQQQIATITINRPERRNAITYDMWVRLSELFTQINDDEQIRIVIIQGAGDNAFSAGGDIQEFPQRRDSSWQANIYNGKVELAMRALVRLEKPTIALIKGYCIGGGCVLAAHCDLRFAATNSQFGVPVGKLGALVDYHELKRLIQLVGVGVTTDLLLTGRLLAAEEAKTVGLCSLVFPLEEISDAVLTIARDMCNVAPLTQRWHKQMIQTVLEKPDLIDLEPEETALPEACFETEDYAEGIQAFLEKRKPRFHGR